MLSFAAKRVLIIISLLELDILDPLLKDLLLLLDFKHLFFFHFCDFLGFDLQFSLVKLKLFVELIVICFLFDQFGLLLIIVLDLPVKEVLLLVLVHCACVQAVIHLLFLDVVERCEAVEGIAQVYSCSGWASLTRICAFGFLLRSRWSLLTFVGIWLDHGFVKGFADTTSFTCSSGQKRSLNHWFFLLNWLLFFFLNNSTPFSIEVL